MKRLSKVPPSRTFNRIRNFVIPALCLTFAAGLAFGVNPPEPPETCPIQTCPTGDCGEEGDESCTSGTTSSGVQGGMGPTAADEGSTNSTGSPAGDCANSSFPTQKKPEDGGLSGVSEPIQCPSSPAEVGSTHVSSGGLRLNVNLGKSAALEACLSGEKPSATPMTDAAGFSTGGSNYSDNIYSRGYGTVSGMNAGQYEKESGTNKLSVVRTGDSTVLLSDLGGGAAGYDMQIYKPSDVTGSTPVSGAVPMRTVRIIKQSDEGSGTYATKVGRMLELRGTSGGKITEFRFKTLVNGGKSWETKEGRFTGTLASPGITFIRSTEIYTTPGTASSYSETRTVTDLTTSATVLKEKDTYTKITLSTGPVYRLTRHQTDPDGKDLTTERWYHTSGPAAGMIQRVHYDTGFWRHYEYMLDTSRLFRTYEPFENTAPPAAVTTVPDMAGTVVTEHDFTSTPGWYRRDTVYTDGNVTSRTWTKKTGNNSTGITWTVTRASDPSAAVDAADNQTQVSIHYPQSITDPTTSNRLKRVESHDNQVTQYTYTKLTALGTLPARIRTVAQTGPNPGGAPSGGLYTLTEGTERTTEVTLGGQPVIEKVKDIASGKILRDIVVEDSDDYGRPTVTLDQLLGRYKYAQYACCGVEWEQDFDGIITHNLYEDWSGELKEQQKGYRPSDDDYTSGIQNWISHYIWARDALGRTTEEKRVPHDPSTGGTAGTPQTVSITTYNTAGEVTAKTDAMGKTHRFNTGRTSGYVVESKSWPLSGTPALYRTEVTKYNRSTSVYSTSIYASSDHCHTALIPSVYSSGSGDIGNSLLHTSTYSRGSSGYSTERRNNAGKSGTGISEYEVIFRDCLGRTIYLYQPSSSGGTLITYYYYYTAAQSTSAKASFGKLRQVNYPDGRTVFYEYDAQGRQSREILDLNNDSKDLSSDRVVETTHSVGAAPGSATMGAYKTVTKIYLDGINPVQASEETESANGLYSKVNKRGRVTETTKEISANGALYITTKHPDSTETITGYSGGNLVSESKGYTIFGSWISNLGYVTYGYDSLGRLSLRYDGYISGWTNYTYRSDDRTATVSEWLNGSTSTELKTIYEYDDVGNNIQTTLPDASAQAWAYNALGQMTESNGVQQYPVKYEYDDRGGRLRKLTTGVGTSGVEGTTMWTYNAYGWLTQKRDAAGKGVDYLYNSKGQIYQRQGARTLPSSSTRLTAAYTYDSYTGGLLSVAYNDGGTPGYSMTYDRLGRLDLVTQGLNSWDYAYDSTTLLLDTETVAYGSPGLTRVIDRSNDSLSRDKGWILKTTGGVTEHSNTYAYDTNHGRLKSVSDGTDTFTYDYLAGTNRVATLSGPNSMVVNNEWEHYSPRNVLVSRQNMKGSTEISKYTYVINNLSRRDNVTQSGTTFGSGGTTYWHYNGRGELDSADHYDAITNDRFYTYDTAGNRTQWRYGTATSSGGTAVTYTANTRNQYAGVSGGRTASPTYDDDGNQLTTFLPVDPTKIATWAWDAENRLIEAKSNGIQIGTYQYDPFGRRISKTVTSTGATTSFIYDGWNLIAEYTSSGSSTPTFERAHTWGLDMSGSFQGAGGVGGLLSTRITTLGTAARYYPLYDGNGNIGQYLNSSGTIVFGVEYDPFGAVSVTHWPTVAFFFRFSTKFEDFETGLNYYGYRYLDSQNGRWINRDPIGELGGGNLYRMVNNNGINSYDLLGLDTYPDRRLNPDRQEELEKRCPCKGLTPKVSDQFERECCEEDLQKVSILKHNTKLDLTDFKNPIRDFGHAAIETPNQTAGLYPMPRANKQNQKTAGRINDDAGTIFPDGKITYKACPESVKKVDNWINDQRDRINEDRIKNKNDRTENPFGGKPDETYQALNGETGRNCFGWTCEGIQQAGGTPPFPPKTFPLVVR